MRRIPLNMVTMKAIDAIYAKLPKINCQKKCQECCGQVMMTDFEFQRIVNRTGRNPPIPNSLLEPCHWLKDGGCKVYDIRPAICRLWGLVDFPIMKCPFGCVPERWLSNEEGLAIIDEIQRLSDG